MEKMKSTLSHGKRWHNWIKKHSVIFVSLSVFLLFFIGGMRFNMYIALLLALTDTLFSVGIYYIFKTLLKKQKYLLKNSFLNINAFILCLIALSLLLLKLEMLISQRLFPALFEPFSQEKMHHLIGFRFLKSIILALVAFSVALYNHLRQQKEEVDKMSIEKEHIHFQLLKAQINPHFLFNALNNIYALTYVKDSKAPDALMKLADMLRYVTNMSQENRVQLYKEIDYIRAYLDFQTMRFDTKVAITFDVDVDDAHQFISPMILQPYIENCFNHGDLATNPNGYVSILLHVKNKSLHFKTLNSKGSHSCIPKNKPEGLGKLNVEQRLKLYYKDAFSINIQDGEQQYVLELILDLAKNAIYV